MATSWHRPPRTNYERTPDARHWRTRSCPSSSATPRAKPGRTSGAAETIWRHYASDPAATGRRPSEHRDDPGGAGHGYHVDVLHVRERPAPSGRSDTISQRMFDSAGPVSAVPDVHHHVDHHAARAGFGDIGAHPDHPPAPTRPADGVRHRVFDSRG